MRFASATIAFLILGAGTAQAADHHVRAGATGTASGDDWTNAYPALPATLIRGDTYYVADGNYSGRVLNTAVSGTALITIRKATIAQHGSSVGWSDAYGDGQAEFSSGFDFNSGYWVIDGATGGGPGQWESNFGFFVNMAPTGAQDRAVGITSGTVTSITLQHIDVKGRGRLYAGGNTDLIYITSGVNNLTIRNCLLRDTDRTMILSWPATVNGVLIEYTKFARNGNAEHREAWSFGVDDNVVVRYNLFEDILGTGVLAGVNNSGDADNWEIYGNIFYWTGIYADGIINTGLIVVKYASPTLIVANNWRFHNNTIANIRNGSYTTAISAPVTTNFSARNNIWYNNNGTTGAGSTNSDYNWFFANESNNTAGANDIVGSSSPFADAQPWLTGNWALKAALPGFTVGAPYNMDMLGRTRGSDGVWDRGAMEFGVNGPPPSAPTNLQVQ